MNTERQGFSPEAEGVRKTEVEPGESLEKVPEKISATEAVIFAGLLGLKAYVFYDSKREEIRRVVDETKQDLQAQPVAAKEIVGGLIAQLGSLVLEHQREQQEQKLRIRQKFLSSLQKIAIERNQLDLLKDYEALQGEAIQEYLRKPREKAKISGEEKAEFKALMDPVDSAKQQAKDKVMSFINGLLNSSR